MCRFTIKNIVFKTMEEDLKFEPKGINIIVGPNNSGKSKLLKEIRDYLTGDNKDINIIKDLDYNLMSDFNEFCLTYDIESKMVKDRYGNWLMKIYTNKPDNDLDMTTTLDHYYTRNINAFSEDWSTRFERVFNGTNSFEFLHLFGPLFYQYLGTEERLTICKTQKNHGMDESSINYLSSIQYDSELLDKLNKIIKKIFKKEIYLDDKTLGGRLVFRVGNDFNYVHSKIKIDRNEAIKLFNEKKLDNQGDGLKSFVSTFLSLYLNKGDILLIDEPEAFLHPPLARQLGEMIGEYHQNGQAIFISTHSVEILKGILSKNQDVNVIRITQPVPFSNSIKIINKNILELILQNPLLRVSRVLEGLFCEKVILTEAESDELVYQELMEKIFPASGLYFVHGQNKQTLAIIGKLYKEIGISYEIITDFDILRKPSELSPFLSLMDISDIKRQKIISYANQIRTIVDETVDVSQMEDDEAEKAKKHKRDEVYHKIGVNFFEEKEKNKISKIIEQLSKKHLHILATGELETLLKDYDVPYQEKNKWIVEAINRIEGINKEDIANESYLFKFLTGIKED